MARRTASCCVRAILWAADPTRACSEAVSHCRVEHDSLPSLFTDAKPYSELDGNTRVLHAATKGKRTARQRRGVGMEQRGALWPFRDESPLALEVLE